MTPPILAPAYLVSSLGELARLPDGSIINIGGVKGPDFTVGGKPLIFADGTTTDGSGDGLNLNVTLQNAYDKSIEALINLIANKNFVLQAGNENKFIFDANTGIITISGDLVVQGNLISNLSFNAVDIIAETEHLVFITGNNVQEAINSIDETLRTITSNETPVRAYEHIQDQASTTWIIPHNKNTKRIQISIWDLDDELLFSDMVKIVDANTVVVAFSSPAVGRAILMAFPL